MTAPDGPGLTGSAYAAVAKVDSFSQGMSRLAELFIAHPELHWLQAATDPSGHVDIIVTAGTGVLRDWVHALPAARRKQDLFSVHSGAAFEDLLIDGSLTVHVRASWQLSHCSSPSSAASSSSVSSPVGGGN